MSSRPPRGGPESTEGPGGFDAPAPHRTSVAHSYDSVAHDEGAVPQAAGAALLDLDGGDRRPAGAVVEPGDEAGHVVGGALGLVGIVLLSIMGLPLLIGAIIWLVVRLSYNRKARQAQAAMGGGYPGDQQWQQY